MVLFDFFYLRNSAQAGWLLCNVQKFPPFTSENHLHHLARTDESVAPKAVPLMPPLPLLPVRRDLPEKRTLQQLILAYLLPRETLGPIGKTAWVTYVINAAEVLFVDFAVLLDEKPGRAELEYRSSPL